ncbi:unnamed protein product [Didymodactylos carnosus]|uniref:Deacetylase sirtuin-type domain-containing protein n=1 Tax=Didymodactylos carnosus TaxID=1234261 RepID=A0A814KBC9_9BILA|nr:unnamed protein product [Didymodactylos carnosus]CAF1047132.1 unnamed protein product [Didymodactylos carnosus]CAF3719519.1 unnamed protein product [Didymodactylos carnosus]CAF3816889.1 unnamed protein product [Didymodactylos carnosus]
MLDVVIHPFGEVDPELTEFIRSKLETRFNVNVIIGENHKTLPVEINKERKQYPSTPILRFLENLSTTKKQSVARLGIVTVDLYVSHLNFVFGEASGSTHVAVFSTNRLNPTRWNEKFDKQKFFERSLVEAVHELGHAFGLKHCDKTDCVMWFSNTLEETDRKGILNAFRALKTDENENVNEPVLKSFDLKGAADYMKNCENIIVMSGAGISTSAGIPDFRSPDTGLYSQLEKYNLPFPEAVFHLEFFKKNPKPFFLLAKELYPENFKPTPAHYFIRLLNEKKKLLRVFTQNIDSLERVAEIPADKIVEAHGTFFTSHCIDCKEEYSLQHVKDIIFKDEIPTCLCGGIIKPDIIFFGERLPDKFHTLRMKDFPKADFLIIIGTSLMVAPFSHLISNLYADDYVPLYLISFSVNRNCPRLLINMEPVGIKSANIFSSEPLMFNSDRNRRDVFYQGSCDDGVFELAKLLDWEDDFKKLLESVGSSAAQKKVATTSKLAEEDTITPAVATASAISKKLSKSHTGSEKQKDRSISPKKNSPNRNRNSPNGSQLNEAIKNADELAKEMAEVVLEDGQLNDDKKKQ